MARKTKTFDQVERTQAKAVRFLRDVVGDPDKADEIEDLSPEEYAERKGFEIVEENPSRVYGSGDRRHTMTKPELEARIAELEEENEDLQSRLDSIVDIVQPEAGDTDDDEDDEDWGRRGRRGGRLGARSRSPRRIRLVWRFPLRSKPRAVFVEGARHGPQPNPQSLGDVPQ